MISLPSFLSSLGENYIVSIIILKFAAWLPSTAISLHTRFMIVQCPLKVKKKKKKKKNLQIIPAPAALVKYLISAEKR